MVVASYRIPVPDARGDPARDTCARHAIEYVGNVRLAVIEKQLTEIARRTRGELHGEITFRMEVLYHGPPSGVWPEHNFDVLDPTLGPVAGSLDHGMLSCRRIPENRRLTTRS